MREVHLNTGAAADPIALHGQNALGPAGSEAIAAFEECLSIGGDAQEPLLQLFLRHRR